MTPPTVLLLTKESGKMALDVLDVYISEMVLDVMYGVVELNSDTLHKVTVIFVSHPQMDCEYFQAQ